MNPTIEDVEWLRSFSRDMRYQADGDRMRGIASFIERVLLAQAQGGKMVSEDFDDAMFRRIFGKLDDETTETSKLKITEAMEDLKRQWIISLRAAPDMLKKDGKDE